MKTCDDCKHAEWQRTTVGRLHPNKQGQCAYPYRLPPLPASMCWWLCGNPRPSGGAITRGQELPEHCVYWERKS
jgi:hypothetical protein